jgi:SAM-dependent methyltransferase
MSVQAFYDDLAPLYHLVYQDWETTVARQGEALASLIGEHWGADARTVLDAAVGIGTQALGLLARGFRVTGLDLSPRAVARAAREAALRRLPLPCLVADFRSLPVRAASVDVVLVCDNALPHLDSETDIRRALTECFRCVRRGGGCLISMRDYPSPSPPSGTVEVRPYGERLWAGRRYGLRQVWTWRGSRYDLSFEFTPADAAHAEALALKTSYLAIPVEDVAGLMRAVGFEKVRRVDGRFFQPVLVGTRPAVEPTTAQRRGLAPSR